MCTSSSRTQRVRGQRYSGLEACKIEKEIESFVENFKKKGSTLDRPPVLERPPSLESTSSSQSGIPSSLYSTDDLTDDSPEKSGYLMPEIVRRYRYCSTTTSDSEGGEDDFRRLMLAYKDSKKHDSVRSSITEGPDGGPGDVMGTDTCPYSVLDVAQLLQSRYAYISGAKAKNGAPILTFPDRPNQAEPTDEEYRKVVTYLCSIPAIHDIQQGLVLLVDRRQSGWGSVKTILMRFSSYFPCHIQVVFLLQPHGFFQRAFSDYRSKFKEDLEYTVVSVDTPQEVLDYIEADNMTTEVGGNLQFDADEWTQHRSAVEKFSSNTEKISLALTKLIKKFDSILTPNDVEGTEKQIRDNVAQKRELLEDLESASFHGQTLLSCIKGENPRTPMVHVTHVLTIESLLLQLEETEKQFSDYWDKHYAKLNQSLQLRKFEEEFKQFQLIAVKNMDWLEEKMMECGDSVKRVDELAQELTEFEEKANREIENGEKMRSEGEQFIMDDHYAVDSIRPKCIELQRMCDQYRQLLRRRREILTKSQDLQERIEKANHWCSRGIDMLASQPLEKAQTPEGTQKAIQEIDEFMATVSQLQLNNPKEFRQKFESMITAETRANVQKVLKRLDDVQSMCTKRKTSLVSQSRQKPRPSQQPPPLEVVTAASARGQHTVPEYDLKRKGHRENPQKVAPMLEKSARLRVERSSSIQHPHQHARSPHSSTSTSSTHSLTDSVDQQDRARNSVASNSTTSGSSSVSEPISEQSATSLQSKRAHVLNELIDTEKKYVQQLHDILRGYYCEMDNRTMQHLIPDELAGKKDTLFGNLDQIYRFHHDVFLKDLQSCEESPSKLGKCFVNRKDQFQLYSLYCQNKPRSEELRTQIGDNNPFFKECQRKLNHKLPLGAYLLKPVQRITKYQLLLKEMLKYTKDDKTFQQQLEDSLNTMLEVVRIVNNSMYEVSIVGFKGNLSDLGKLLMQGSFNVWTEHKHEKIRDFRFKPMQRHLFLYEKAILLCKRKEDTVACEKDAFTFKNILRCNQVGLTENIKGDKRKIELWLRGREEVYIVQAPSLEIKDFWVKEIKKVLMGQFDEMRLNKLNLQRSSEDLSKSYVSGSDSGLESWRHRQGSGNNNTSTVPVGLGMMSPETPPEEPMEQGRWSDGEFTDSDPEGEQRHENYVSPVEPTYLQQYKVVADYAPVDEVEMTLQEGDVVEILRTGSTGWWLAHHLTTNEEGWVPSSYLDPVPKTGSRSYVSVSSIGSSSIPEHLTSRSSLTSGYSATSPVDETKV